MNAYQIGNVDCFKHIWNGLGLDRIVLLHLKSTIIVDYLSITQVFNTHWWILVNLPQIWLTYCHIVAVMRVLILRFVCEGSISIRADFNLECEKERRNARFSLSLKLILCLVCLSLRMNDVYDRGIGIHAKLNLTDLFRNYAELLSHEIQRLIRQGNPRIHSLRESRFRCIWSASRGLFDASCADVADDDDDRGSPRESPRIYKLCFLHKFEFENASLWCREVNFKFEWPELNWIIALCVCVKSDQRANLKEDGDFPYPFISFSSSLWLNLRWLKAMMRVQCAPWMGLSLGNLPPTGTGMIVSFRFALTELALLCAWI